MKLPPIFFYGFGILLIVVGGLRAYYLGWLRRPDVPEDLESAEGDASADDDGAGEDAEDHEIPVRERERRRLSAKVGKDNHRRHIAMGAIWIVLGLFLLVSTILNRR